MGPIFFPCVLPAFLFFEVDLNGQKTSFQLCRGFRFSTLFPPRLTDPTCNHVALAVLAVALKGCPWCVCACMSFEGWAPYGARATLLLYNPPSFSAFLPFSKPCRHQFPSWLPMLLSGSPL
eukprot:GGOE01022232.1.p3 GENE.GGOE01022232.1~~GGOE01022232.1.p3  ORF type:complete len:121 (-),score=4.90 GGOE01022232.1:103-465(-)